MKTMNTFRIRHLVFSLLMIIMMVLIIASGSPDALAADTIRNTDVSTASSGNTMVIYEGEYKYLAKAEILARINEIRLEACREGVRDPRNLSRNLTEADYVPIKWSSDLEWIAQIRSAEGTMRKGHIRPNGKSCSSLKHNGIRSVEEDLAWNGSGDILYGINQWYGEKKDWVNDTGEETGHYTSMINPANTYIGVGAFDSSVSTSGWGTVCAEFQRTSGLDETQASAIGKCKQWIEVTNDSLDIIIDIDSVLHQGSEKTAVFDPATIYNGVFGTVSLITIPGTISWSSTNTGVATIDQTGLVKGIGSGKTTIKAALNGEEYSKEIEIEGHAWESSYTVDKDPTCTESGEKSIHCSKCSATKDKQTVPAKGHSYGAWETVTTAGCESAGLKQRVCSACGHTDSQNLDPTGHTWENGYTRDVEATCTEDGSESIHCAKCDAVKDSRVIPATDHNYGGWIYKDPTCTKDGYRKKTCKKCGDVVTEVIPTSGHSWSSTTSIDMDATCTKTGYKSIHCEKCNATKDGEIIPALGHEWESKATLDKPASCTENGTEAVHCDRCHAVKPGSEKTIPKTGHDFSDWVAVRTATETTEGLMTRSCPFCGAAETKAIAQLQPTLPAVKISKPKAAKKSATVKWKKISKKNLKKIDRIQIQYSTDSSFNTGVRTVTAKKKAASKKISKLAPKNTYYVRVRAYKADGGTEHVSAWSAVKAVKVK